MNDTSKLLLTVTLGGIVLGTALSRNVSTSMNAAPDAEWRERYRASYSDTSMQFVDLGPVDLGPSTPWPGARFAMGVESPYDRYNPKEGDYADPAMAPEPADTQADKDFAIADQIEEAADQAANIATRIEPAPNTISGTNHIVSHYSFDPVSISDDDAS